MGEKAATMRTMSDANFHQECWPELITGFEAFGETGGSGVYTGPSAKTIKRNIKSLGKQIANVVVGKNNKDKPQHQHQPQATLISRPLRPQGIFHPAVEPEDSMAVQDLVSSLRAVDFCTEQDGGIPGADISSLVKYWQNNDIKFPLGCFDDIWYAWQPRDIGCRPNFMIRDGLYPQVWHCPTIVRVQRCFNDKRTRDDADGITGYHLGTIWASRRINEPGMPPEFAPSSSLLKYWKPTSFRLMVEMESDDGKATGRPTGAVWIVNDSGYSSKDVKKVWKTRVEGVLLARIADSLSDLLDCKKSGTWPKFEEAEADYLIYCPCYQKRIGGANRMEARRRRGLLLRDFTTMIAVFGGF
ncbi:hypothetical protein PG995_002989 [Apiospora arundinis]